MGYNTLDVTAGKGDVAAGQLWFFPGGYEGEIDLSFEPSTETGWVQGGYASTDGVTVDNSADKNEKRVWGNLSLGSTYSNFASTVTVQHASSTDPDLLGRLYGSGNVAVEAVSGNITINSKGTQPEVATLLINAVTDDGRKNKLVIWKAQPDLNRSFSMTDDEITVIEATYDCVAIADGTTWTQLIEGIEAPATEPDPEV